VRVRTPKSGVVKMGKVKKTDIITVPSWNGTVTGQPNPNLPCASFRREGPKRQAPLCGQTKGKKKKTKVAALKSENTGFGKRLSQGKKVLLKGLMTPKGRNRTPQGTNGFSKRRGGLKKRMEVLIKKDPCTSRKRRKELPNPRKEGHCMG